MGLANSLPFLGRPTARSREHPMIKTILYLVMIVALGVFSAWLGQKWRLEGVAEETAKIRDGNNRYKTLENEGRTEAERTFNQKKAEARIAAAQIEELARQVARGLELEGQEIRTKSEHAGDIATRDNY